MTVEPATQGLHNQDHPTVFRGIEVRNLIESGRRLLNEPAHRYGLVDLMDYEARLDEWNERVGEALKG
jgi:hypothetical protein